jgi:hypothetical protein
MNEKYLEDSKKERLFCILTKHNNNFFSTVLKTNQADVLFYRSCGNLEDIQGSKKSTPVGVEILGKETFIEIFRRGFRDIQLDVVFKFKVDKFARSFLRGVSLYGKPFLEIRVFSDAKLSHNGLRAKKRRRV